VSGMPILDVDHAKNVIVIKRSMGQGYAESTTSSYTDPKTGMFSPTPKRALRQSSQRQRRLSPPADRTRSLTGLAWPPPRLVRRCVTAKSPRRPRSSSLDPVLRSPAEYCFGLLVRRDEDRGISRTAGATTCAAAVPSRVARPRRPGGLRILRRSRGDDLVVA